MSIQSIGNLVSPLAICGLLVLLSGCTTTRGLSLMPTATDTGAQAQAASGRGLLAALNGGLVGKVANVQLRNADMRLALEAEYKALEYTAPAQPVYWKSADQLVSGTVVPSQPYRVGAQDCRQYTVFLTQRDSTSEQRGTACRNEDGSWSLLA